MTAQLCILCQVPKLLSKGTTANRCSSYNHHIQLLTAKYTQPCKHTPGQASPSPLVSAQVNTKPGARKAKKPGKKKKDDPAVEHEDLDDDEEQPPHTQELEDAAGLPNPSTLSSLPPFPSPFAPLPSMSPLALTG